jgi:1,4-alpha-glucan branching enzyme
MASASPRSRSATKAVTWDEVLRGRARARLEAGLPAYLSRQRWFGGKARRIRRADVRGAAPVRAEDPATRLTVVSLSYRDGAEELYAIPLVLGPAPRGEGTGSNDGALVATLEVGRQRVAVRAADADPAFARELLAAIREGRALPGRGGTLAASPTAAFDRHAAATEAIVPRPLGAEQSNTSFRFDDRLVVKLFRRTGAGRNPDVELGTFLTEAARFPNVPPVLGTVEFRPEDGEPVSLALLQAFVPNDGDAWTLALREVAGFLDRLPPGGDGVPPSGRPLLELAEEPAAAIARERIGPFLEQAALLGRRTAELHLALASRADLPALAPEPFTPEDARALSTELREHAREVLALLRRRRAKLAPAVRPLADRVLSAEDRFLRRIAEGLDGPLRSPRLRLHGDYHLGQVLHSGRDFVVIDFEGEPARPLAQRRAKGSPLKDVAGMIRSFHYAAHAGLEAHREGGATGGSSPGDGWAGFWYEHVAAAFLRAYLAAARGGGILPAERRELAGLLAAHLVDKALYELAYELNNRPDWVALPLEGLAGLLQGDAPGRGSERSARLPAAPGAPVAVTRNATPAAPAAVRPEGGPGPREVHLFHEGTNHRAYRTMGAHLAPIGGAPGTVFAIWAPNADHVAVMGEFNGWSKDAHPLARIPDSGIWRGFVPGVGKGSAYKYHLRSRRHGHAVDKADPFGFLHEQPPRTASIVWDLEYAWGDQEWMASRRERGGAARPMSVYEVHLGSWRRVPEEGNRVLGYREAAPLLAEHAAEMGFTHVELLPICEHPFYGSWGYQTTGYFAPTSRLGTPQDLMYLVDTLHRRGIGVLLDWVPSHFPADEHGLAYFDGTHLFEHADRRQGHHPDWDSYVFNYGRHEVRSFLISSALFWLDHFHVDGLRVDAVASMLYLDYSRRPGEWIPNPFGGRENLEAIAFLRTLNEIVYREYPDVHTVAEESTAWPMVSRPLYVGGLGFGMKWDMGWMHDTLRYLAHDPIHRKFHHNEITFRMMYAFSENFVLPLSHDEVVHGKGSLLEKMPGDDWAKFANLRLLYGYMWSQPGKKLLFMGGELAQRQEWSHERSLDWHLLELPPHGGVRAWVRDLNHLLRAEPALHAKDFDPAGFEWIDCNDAESSVLAFLRRGGPDDGLLLVVLNFTPVARRAYRIGVPRGGTWTEVLNSDATLYGGSGWGNLGGVEASPVSSHGRPFALALALPPLAAVFLRSAPPRSP